MHRPTDSRPSVACGILRTCAASAIVALSTSGCESDNAVLALPSEQTGQIVLDGNVEEWPQDVACVADGEYVHLRFTVQGEPYTLQAGRSTLSLYFDVDGDSDSGAKIEPVGGAVLEGADLEIQLSPTGAEPGAPKRGVEAYTIDKTGQKAKLPRGGAEFVFAPTYASTWYEARLARNNPLLPTLAGDGTVRGMMVQWTAKGSVLGYSDVFETVLPPQRPAAAQAKLLAKPRGALRVLSYNVLKNRPETEPEPFARVLRAINPDVVLLQEWTAASEAEIAQWFQTHAGAGEEWHVVKAAGVDTSVAAKFPMREAGEPLEVSRGDGGMRKVPHACAIVETPYGDVVVSSVHLKCCGSSGSTEDMVRVEEARVLNALLKEVSRQDERALACIVGGDFNLVGTRTPIDLLRMGLDMDGSDLSIADARVLGDLAYYTWADDASGFSPGRLDFVLFSDVAARQLEAFVLDTARLSAEELERTGLEPTDSSASDHLPVVVDLLLRN